MSGGARVWTHSATSVTEEGTSWVVEDPPDQVRAVESRGGTGGRGIGDRGWGKVRRGKVEEGRGKWARVRVMRSEREEMTYTR